MTRLPIAPPRSLADAILDRYRRAAGAWVRPPNTILRQPPAPVVLTTRVRVTAPVRIVHRDIALTMVSRASRPASPVTTRALARRARIEPAWPGRPAAAPPTFVSVMSQDAMAPASAPLVRPPQMVLSRPHAAPASGTASTRPAAADRGDGVDVIAARTHAQPTLPASSHSTLQIDDVTRLTDRVVAAIDRRLSAYRERVRA